MRLVRPRGRVLASVVAGLLVLFPAVQSGGGAEPASAGIASDASDISAARALVATDEARRVTMLAQASAATVCIFPRTDPEGGGSGVLISPDGLGLSNYHVVAEFLDTRRGYGALSDGRIYPLQVLGIDPGGDIVMFRLEGRTDFPYAPLGDSDTLRVGQWVAAIGNPFLLAEDYIPTVTVGIISGLHRYQEGQGNLLEYADCIQVSTSINPGNSGGPLFDAAGRVIGINGRASFEERGRVNVGLGYAVTINQVRRFLPCLRAGLLCEHGTLGATVIALGSPAAGVTGGSGVTGGPSLIFNAIQQGSPTEKSGIRLRDELLSVNGRSLRTPNDFNNAISILPAEWPTRLSISRGGEVFEVTARLERLPARLEQPFIPSRTDNVAEQRRLLERFAESGLGTSWRNWSRTADQRGPAPRLALAGPGEPQDSPPAEPPSAEPPSAGPPWAGLSSDAELGAALLAPLWSGALPHENSYALGGDEVAGRLVAVLEERKGSRRLRWMFDWETGAWLAASAGTAAEPEQVRILLSSRLTVGAATLPARWEFQRAGATPVVLELTPP